MTAFEDLSVIVSPIPTWSEIGETAGLRPAAVLVLCGVREGVAAPPAGRDAADAQDVDILLLTRARTMTHHAGQISLPGGRRETTDLDVAATALREAAEETGLDPRGVTPLGVLGPLPVAISAHMVTPVVAWWSVPSAVAVVDPGETADVFRVSVDVLADPANRRTAVRRHGCHTMCSPAFCIPGRPDQLIWGLTGHIVAQVLDLTHWSRPWDRDRDIDPLAAGQ